MYLAVSLQVNNYNLNVELNNKHKPWIDEHNTELLNPVSRQIVRLVQMVHLSSPQIRHYKNW